MKRFLLFTLLVGCVAILPQQKALAQGNFPANFNASPIGEGDEVFTLSNGRVSMVVNAS